MLGVIILAAGGGTRMKSRLPKMLHKVAGQSLIHHVLLTAQKISPDKLIVVLGHEKDLVEQEVAGIAHQVAYQEEQLGTAHAVLQAAPLLEGFKGRILILYGDTPLITQETISKLNQKGLNERPAVVLATMTLADPTGYGRIIRDATGTVKKIVEEKDATPDEKNVKEVNTGIYCFEAGALLSNLTRVSKENEQNEYYLTDLISLLVSQNKKVTTLDIDQEEALGVNSRKDLSKVGKIMKNKINDRLMEAGVTFEDPAAAYIEKNVSIGKDTVIGPNVIIKGKTSIGESCQIGQNTYIEDCVVKDGAKIISSHLASAEIGKRAQIGPFSHIRPGTVVGEGAKVGAFSEVKKSTVGPNSKVPHLSYIGDSQIGKDVNVGAGTITCNYDGKKKHKTVIEDGAFIGSDTMLVAPIKVGKRAYTGAGSVLTRDVPDDTLGIERCEQKNIKGWPKKKMNSE